MIPYRLSSTFDHCRVKIQKAFWLSALALGSLSSASLQAAPDLTGYTLSFSDEFTAMDIAAPSQNPTTKWISKPGHGAGFGNASFVNQSNGFPFSIVDGALRITCKKVGTQWQSGLISSVYPTTANPEGVGFSQAMGYWEARMKFPAGSGVWPGFWLLGKGRLANPREQVAEIDIVEYYCQPIDQFSEVLHVWSPTGQKMNGQQYNHAVGSNLTTGFHTYSVLIKDDFISYYWDGVLKWQVATPPEAKKPMWVMAEYAIGAGWPIDETAINNSYTDIDYIRVYAPPAGGPPGTLPSGVRVINAKHSGKCLDGGGFSGGNVKQYPYTGATDQQWTVVDGGSGQYSFRELATSAALQVTGASTADNALIQIKSYGPYSHQRWTATPASSGYYRLVSVSSGKAIQVAGSSTADGASVEQYTIGTGSNQEFSFVDPAGGGGGGGGSLPSGTQKILAKHSGKCLDGGGFSGGSVKQNPYTGATDQQWSVTDFGSGQYAFREVATNAAMQITGASTADGALIQIKSYGPYNHQKWTATPASSGYYRLVSVSSGKAIQVAGGSTADGASVEQYTMGTGSNQEFAFLAP